jgi:prolyl 4-hydroxylase
MLQPVTPELIRWIAEQRQAGFSEDVILRSMMKSGWNESSALEALSHNTPISIAPKPEEITPALRGFVPGVPEPKVSEGVSSLWAGDREVKVLSVMKLPRVVVFGAFMSDEECDAVREAASPRLARSQTVKTDTGGSEVNQARTSHGMFFGRGENELCQRIESRIATLLNWPVDNGEGLQVLHYQPGAEYKPHYDYFDPAHAGSASILKRGGQRVGTLVMYLNTPACGGSTTFPDVGLEVRAVKGNAVFFSYDRPDPATRTLHGGSPVVEGEKWVATKWLRQGHFE